MDYYFDLRFCPFWDRDGPFRDRESAVWDRCGPVGARLGPFSTGFGPVSDRLRFQLLGHEIRTAFCIVFTLVCDVGDYRNLLAMETEENLLSLPVDGAVLLGCFATRLRRVC